jgi:hypothetical protein
MNSYYTVDHEHNTISCFHENGVFVENLVEHSVEKTIAFLKIWIAIEEKTTVPFLEQFNAANVLEKELQRVKTVYLVLTTGERKDKK